MRKRKMVAPIVITALMAVFLFLYLGLILSVSYTHLTLPTKRIV